IKAYGGAAGDSIRSDAIDYVGIKTINFTNVRKLPAPNKKIRLWSFSNFDFSYSFTSTRQQNPLIENNGVKKHLGGIGYTYISQPKYIEPFKKTLKSKSKLLDFVRSFNVNPKPNLIGVRWDTRRQFGAIRPRNVGGGPFKVPETFDKYFVIDRIYNVRWDLTKSFNVDFKAVNNSRIDEPYGRLDTREKRDSVRSNFLKGGRNTLYNQSADFTYNFPTTLFPFLDWTTANLAFRTTYSWIGASRLAIALGNTIQNGNQKGATVEFNFAQLYAKSRVLRTLSQPQAPAPPPVNQKTTDTTLQKGNAKLKKVKGEPQLNGATKSILNVLTAIKRVGVTYNEGATTFLPGYMDSTKFLGNNFNSMAPGIDFVFGRQPDSNWLKNAASRGLISGDSIQNNLFRQTYDQRLSINAQLEPVRDLIIDINLDKSLNKTYTSLFKDTTGNKNFAELSPY
ncbi:MAG: cell surface protein SprA, partial [Chitinophagaceae bacterium]